MELNNKMAVCRLRVMPDQRIRNAGNVVLETIHWFQLLHIYLREHRIHW